MKPEALQKELNARWEALPTITDKEMIVALLRALVGDRDMEGLPNYQASVNRMNEELVAKYGEAESPNDTPTPTKS